MIGLLFGGIIKSALGFLKGLPWQVWAGLGALVAALLLWHAHTNAEKRAYNDAFNTGYHAAAKQFNDAQAKADKAARSHVAVTVVKQDQISKDSSNALLHANDDIDARAERIRVRHDAQASDRGSTSGAVNPTATSQAASGPCQAAGQDGLSWSAAFPLMLQAEKNQAQLFAVLDWEAKQEAIDDQERADEAKEKAK